ncbi:MAG: ABC transporter substrate-binding protein [Alphaproteobacteria bacterium]|nr:ABC transporter substrate-binding protein [Alphaproteobacteria bacterium]
MAEAVLARGITRRRALLSAASVAAMPLARPFSADAAAAEPVRIGLLLAKTGQIAPQTEYLSQGSYLALEQRNNQVMGRPAELVWLDEPSPQDATQNMRKLVQEQKVCAVLGGSLSSNALAEEATAAQLKIPFIVDNAAATEITGQNCNRYTFRLNTPVLVQSRMLAPYALGFGKKWYFITASFAFGQDILRRSRELLKDAGGTEVGVDEVPLNTADFSSFILKIRQAKPDVVLGGLSAGDLSTFLKQWNELGMKGKIPVCEIAIGDTDIWAVGPEAATGIYTSLWWYKNPNNPPEEKAFAEAYQKKYNRPAADKAWMGWITARSLFESLDQAKSTEPMAIIEALENWKVTAGGTSYSYRKWDHQMLLKNLVVQVKDKIPDQWDYFDVKAALPENGADLEKIFGTQEEVGCKMI